MECGPRFAIKAVLTGTRITLLISKIAENYTTAQFHKRRTTMNEKERAMKLQQIIAKAWADEEFKQRLLADATAVLREEGVDVPQGLQVRALENTDKVFHLVLPGRPVGVQELSDDQLDAASGAGFWGTVWEALTITAEMRERQDITTPVDMG